MNKFMLAGSFLTVLGTGVSSNAYAQLADNAVLNFVDSSVDRVCIAWADSSFTSGCFYDAYTDTVIGSYFSMDTNGSGVHEVGERSMIVGSGNGVTMGIAQAVGDIDSWLFFGALGYHFTSAPPVVTSDNGAGNVTAKLNWWVNWNNISNIDMSQGADAVITCSNTCEESDTFVLDYTAYVPNTDPSFGGVSYAVHLEGVIGESGPILPTKHVGIQLPAGGSLECSLSGGSNVDAIVNIVTTDTNDIVSISWMLDGEVVGSGNTLNVFAPLGEHTLSVMVDTLISGQFQSSETLIIKDTTPPELSIHFIDKRNGQEITEVEGNGRHHLNVKYDVSDICDPEPTASGFAVPVYAIDDGGSIMIKGKKLTESTLDTSAINVSADVVDASGNRNHRNATLLVSD